jgi:hypothetical protein
LTRVRRDRGLLEVLLPSLQRLALCRDLTDWQLLLLGDACTLCASPAGAVVVAATGRQASASGPASVGAAAGDADLRDSLVVVCSGSLAVREVAQPAPPPPRFDDGAALAVDDRGAAAGSSAGLAEEDLAVRQVARLQAGEVRGPSRLARTSSSFVIIIIWHV